MKPPVVDHHGNSMEVTDSPFTVRYPPGKRAKAVFGLTGSSNSGKTTLVTHMLQWLAQEGYHVSCIKHAHAGFDMDRPGKDSYQMREAGAQEVFLVGNKRWVLMHEYHGEPEPNVKELVARLSPCDIVLVEGFKESGLPQIEVYRPSTGKLPLWPRLRSILAVASDQKFDCPLPILDLNNPTEVAMHILEHLSRAEMLSGKAG